MPSVGRVFREPSVGGVLGEPSVGRVFREPSVGGVLRAPSVGGVFREPSVGGVLRAPSVGGVLREPSVGRVRRDGPAPVAAAPAPRPPAAPAPLAAPVVDLRDDDDADHPRFTVPLDPPESLRPHTIQLAISTALDGYWAYVSRRYRAALANAQPPLVNPDIRQLGLFVRRIDIQGLNVHGSLSRPVRTLLNAPSTPLADSFPKGGLDRNPKIMAFCNGIFQKIIYDVQESLHEEIMYPDMIWEYFRIDLRQGRTGEEFKNFEAEDFNTFCSLFVPTQSDSPQVQFNKKQNLAQAMKHGIELFGLVAIDQGGLTRAWLTGLMEYILRLMSDDAEFRKLLVGDGNPGWSPKLDPSAVNAARHKAARSAARARSNPINIAAGDVIDVDAEEERLSHATEIAAIAAEDEENYRRIQTEFDDANRNRRRVRNLNDIVVPACASVLLRSEGGVYAKDSGVYRLDPCSLADDPNSSCNSQRINSNKDLLTALACAICLCLFSSRLGYLLPCEISPLLLLPMFVAWDELENFRRSSSDAPAHASQVDIRGSVGRMVNDTNWVLAERYQEALRNAPNMTFGEVFPVSPEDADYDGDEDPQLYARFVRSPIPTMNSRLIGSDDLHCIINPSRMQEYIDAIEGAAMTDFRQVYEFLGSVYACFGLTPGNTRYLGHLCYVPTPTFQSHHPLQYAQIFLDDNIAGASYNPMHPLVNRVGQDIILHGMTTGRGSIPVVGLDMSNMYTIFATISTRVDVHDREGVQWNIPQVHRNPLVPDRAMHYIFAVIMRDLTNSLPNGDGREIFPDYLVNTLLGFDTDANRDESPLEFSRRLEYSCFHGCLNADEYGCPVTGQGTLCPICSYRTRCGACADKTMDQVLDDIRNGFVCEACDFKERLKVMDMRRLVEAVTGSRCYSQFKPRTLNLNESMSPNYISRGYGPTRAEGGTYEIPPVGSRRPRLVLCSTRTMFSAHTCNTSLDFYGLDMALPRTERISPINPATQFCYDDDWMAEAFARYRHYLLMFILDLSLNNS